VRLENPQTGPQLILTFIFRSHIDASGPMDLPDVPEPEEETEVTLGIDVLGYFNFMRTMF